ncbi:MAG: hypothetical protein Q8N53_04830, partial [Longimicrobiales bacterium]|nr:hypothetical protein [Longimicrobiales bacterium]
VPAGTILVVVKSKILMRRLPVAINRAPMCFSQDVKGIIVRDSRLPASYLLRHLRVGQRGLLAQARGVNTEGLTLDHLRAYLLMVPPNVSLALWDRVDGAHRAVRANLARQLTQATQLFLSLSQRAFRGALSER